MKAYITNINVSTGVLKDKGPNVPENALKQGEITVQLRFLVNGNAQAFEDMPDQARQAIADQLRSKLSEIEFDV